MTSKRSFHKTTMLVEVLSEEPFNPDADMNLQAIDYAITQGDCSGQVRVVGREEFQGPRAAKELMNQGSDPRFFRLDESGQDVED